MQKTQFGGLAVSYPFSKLSHPNLPRVLDRFELGEGDHCIVMDFAGQFNLEQLRLQRGGPLPLKQVLGWADQLCDTLTFLHGQAPPIIHRDIKSANIIVSDDDRVLLVDFGIAKQQAAGHLTVTVARATSGGYSPPEQYGSSGHTDPRSDIYALAATLYVLLTNRDLPDSVDVLTGNAKAVKPAHLASPSVPPAVGAALLKAMQIRKEDRFATAQEFKRALH